MEKENENKEQNIKSVHYPVLNANSNLNIKNENKIKNM